MTETWTCKGCDRLRPMCDGAADDYFDYCDRCWAQMHNLPKAMIDEDHHCDICRDFEARLLESKVRKILDD